VGSSKVTAVFVMFVRIKQKNTVMIELEITKEYINPFFFISHFFVGSTIIRRVL
jgi:hypothetical protein